VAEAYTTPDIDIASRWSGTPFLRLPALTRDELVREIHQPPGFEKRSNVAIVQVVAPSSIPVLRQSCSFEKNGYLTGAVVLRRSFHVAQRESYGVLVCQQERLAAAIFWFERCIAIPEIFQATSDG